MIHIVKTLAVTLLVLQATLQPLDAQDWVTKTSEWKGFQRQHFQVDEHQAWMTFPRKAREGNPWIWRARFPGYHAEADLKLLADGFHVGYVDVAGLFGAPRAMQRGDHFYRFVTQNYQLSTKVALEGVSRGGLFVYHWAARQPDRVACIYCDTPVCDFKSWPGGKGNGIGHAASWQQCLAAYGFNESQALAYQQNPIQLAPVLAKARLPLMTIVSDNDRVVPPAENTDQLQKKLQELSHSIEVIRVSEGTEKSNGHHFQHPDPDRVVAFIRRHTVVEKTSP